MTDYTHKEAETIRSAYRALAYIAECSSWSDPARLAAALSHERRGRGILTAKALMVREAWRATQGDPCSAAQMWSRFSPGILTAYMFGAWCAIFQEGRLAKLTGEFIAKAEASNAAHEAMMLRGLEAL